MFRLQVLVLGSVVVAGVLATYNGRRHYPPSQSTPEPTIDPRSLPELLLYDFWSNEQPCIVKSHFKDVKLLKSLKGYGVRRYLFLVENDQSEELKQLSLPLDAYNIRVFSVEHLFAFFSHFNIEWQVPATIPQDDQDLTFLERTHNPQVSQRKWVYGLAELANIFRGTNDFQIFIATAGLPTKFLVFMDTSDYNITEIVLKNTGPLGGPGAVESQILKVFNIVP